MVSISNSQTWKCTLCGCCEYIQREGCARDNTSLVPFECKNCGLVALSSIDHINDSFYADGHMYDFKACDPELELMQSEEDSQRRIEQFGSYFKGKNVLDIGCGAGAFLLKAHTQASQVIGVEPNLTFKKHFEEKQLQVYEKINQVPKSFSPQVITLFHVLEHISNQIEFLHTVVDMIHSRREWRRMCGDY